MRCVQLHQRIGARLEAGYGAQAGEVAAQIAVHFERGGEIRRAVAYWQQAGDNAARRNAYAEAIAATQDGAGAPRAAAGELRAHPARTRAAAHTWGAVDGCQGHGLSRSRRSLQPSLHALPTGGRDPPALPGALGPHRVS